MLAGFAGGFINAILVGWRPIQPINVPKRKKPIYDLGSMGNVLVGGGASFAFWALGIGNPSSPQVYGAAFLSGLGGARLLGDLYRIQAISSNIDSTIDELTSNKNPLILDSKTTAKLLQLILTSKGANVKMLAQIIELSKKKEDSED